VQVAANSAPAREERQTVETAPEPVRAADADYHRHPGADSPGEPAPIRVAVDSTPAADAGAPVQLASARTAVVVHTGHIMRDQLPPDPRMIVTGADLKRERNEQTLGYDRDAMESIRRHEATVSLVKGQF